MYPPLLFRSLVLEFNNRMGLLEVKNTSVKTIVHFFKDLTTPRVISSTFLIPHLLQRDYLATVPL
jgi:hypothetical protein